MLSRKTVLIGAFSILGVVLSACSPKEGTNSQQLPFTAAESINVVRTVLDSLSAHPRLMIDSTGTKMPYHPNWVVRGFKHDSAGFVVSLVSSQPQLELDGPLRIRVTNSGAFVQP